MSEKSLWNWLNKKMSVVPTWRSRRLENCSEKGIPDAVVFFNSQYDLERVTTFIELKDWSESKKHPLLVEQKNFLSDFGGMVLIKAEDLIVSCYGEDLRPLMTCDINWALRKGHTVPMAKFNPEWMMSNLIHCR